MSDEVGEDITQPEEARREKLRQIESLGIDPWGSRFDNRNLSSERRFVGSSRTVRKCPCLISLTKS
jgi:hypothetical protein